MPNISPPNTTLATINAVGVISETASTVVEAGKSNSSPLLYT